MHNSEHTYAGTFSRREVLRGALAGGAVLGTSGIVAACGGSSSPSASATTGATKTSGTLRIGMGSGGTVDSLDPDHNQVSFIDQERLNSLYDGLLVRNGDFQEVPALAEEVTSNATATEWTIRLRPGVEFHNGKTLTSKDLIASILRKTNPKASSYPSWTLVDTNSLKALDSRTVRVGLKSPYAIFPAPLSGYNGFITPEGFDPHHPIGTGPFMYKSFTPGQLSVMEAFPNYWGGRPKVDTLIISNLLDQTARVNALLSGQVDAIDTVPLAEAKSLGSNGQAVVISSPSDAWCPLLMYTDQPPFNDVRVRQAMRLIANRPAILDVAYVNQARLGNDVFGTFDPYYASAGLPQRVQDIDQAKSLLKAAGRSGLTVTMRTAPLAAGLLEATQVYAQQAKLAGVTVNLQEINPSEWGTEYLTWPTTFNVAIWNSLSYLEDAQESLGPNAVYNETRYHNPAFNNLFNQAIAEVDDAKRGDIVHEMMRMNWDSSGYIIPVLPNLVAAFRPNVHGFVREDAIFSGLNNGHLADVSVG